MVTAAVTVLLDAGHGQGNRSPGVYDPGNLGGGLKESYLTLAYAVALERALLREGYAVVMTRRTQEAPTPIYIRARMAEHAGASVMLSIHTNSAANTHGEIDPAPRGTEVLYNGYAERECAVALIATIAGRLGTLERAPLARLAQQLAVMSARLPCYLLELAFQSNASDRARLTAADSPASVADGVSAALRRYYPPANAAAEA